MKLKLLALTILCLTGSAAPAIAGTAPTSAWENSIITVDVNRKGYDYLQPWTVHMENFKKFAVIGNRQQILTTAEYLNDQTLVRVQKNGRGKWYDAQVDWVDYHANLAILSATDTNFWKGLKPVSWTDPVPTQGSVQVIRWRNGVLDSRKGEINRLIVKRAKLSWADYMQMEIDSEINGAGWAEAVVMGSKLVGLTTAQDGNTCTILPGSFIQSILQARQRHTYRGLAYFDFVWEKAENPATLSYLKLPGEPRGVLVIDWVTKPGRTPLLKPKDILLEIDGFPIDTSGDYKDPNYGNLSLENLASRQKWAGDKLQVKIWRDGRQQELTYTLPKVEYTDELVPQMVFDQRPEYMLVGGLIFQPLTEPYLRTWGGDWRRKAPFRLAYYEQEKPSVERPALVILSLVLPDPFNLGYQDYRFLMVDQVNGKKVSRLTDVTEALKTPVDGYDIIEFSVGGTTHRMVLDASQVESATRRVMQRYRIGNSQQIAPTSVASR